MEELLNKLIEKRWKPFRRNSNKAYYRQEWPDEFYFRENGYWYIYNRRQLVSKESWLWQFVCENGMVDNIYCTWDKYDENSGPVPNQQHLDKYYEYRLIESALKDESELESFILDNIKIDV